MGTTIRERSFKNNPARLIEGLVAGTPVFILASLAARLPVVMVSLALILAVSSAYPPGVAGVCAGVMTLASALAGPRLGMLADRLGPRRVLLTSGTGCTIALAIAMVAMRWLAGPAVVAILASAVSALCALAVAAAAVLAGCAALAATRPIRATCPREGERTRAHLRPWRVPGLVPLLAISATTTAAITATELASIHAARLSGTPAAAGWPVAALLTTVTASRARKSLAGP